MAIVQHDHRVRFHEYCIAFYGMADGVYPLGASDDEIMDAADEYISGCVLHDEDGHITYQENYFVWGEGDSFDREHVRQILQRRGYCAPCSLPRSPK